MSVELDITSILRDYYGGMSAKQIAEKHNTYTNKILRTLRRHGASIKDRSTIQKEAMERGERESPMKGKKHDDATRKAIGNSIVVRYDGLDDDDKEKKRSIHRDLWKKRTVESKLEMRAKSSAGLREVSVKGSRLERYIYKNMQGRGYSVRMHKNIAENALLEVDILINRVAVEVQGPAHYFPIWGEEKLEKTRQADQEKLNGLLKAGYSVIHLKHISKRKSESYFAKVLELLIEAVDEIDGKNVFKEIEYDGTT